MTTYFNHQSRLGKFGDLLFARQTPFAGAERHKGVLASISAWKTRRAASAELSGLSDRELADIGLTRQDIPAVVKDAAE